MLKTKEGTSNTRPQINCTIYLLHSKRVMMQPPSVYQAIILDNTRTDPYFYPLILVNIKQCITKIKFETLSLQLRL